MNRSELILAALYPGKSAPYTYTQIANLLFLIQKRTNLSITPEFSFTPQLHGPGDRAIQDALKELEEDNLLYRVTTPEWPQVEMRGITYEALPKAQREFEKIKPRTQTKVAKLSDFVLRHTAKELIVAIWKEYPEMVENTLFKFKS